MMDTIEKYILDNYTSPEFPQKYETFIHDNYQDIVPDLILGDEKLTDITNGIIKGEDVDDSYLGTFKDYYGESVYEPEVDFTKALALQARYIDDAEYLEWLNDDKMAKVLAEFPTRGDLIDHLGPTIEELADKYKDNPNLELLINNMTYKSHPLAFYEFSQSSDFSEQDGDFGFREWIRKGINSIKKLFTKNKYENQLATSAQSTPGDNSVSNRKLKKIMVNGSNYQKVLAQDIMNNRLDSNHKLNSLLESEYAQSLIKENSPDSRRKLATLIGSESLLGGAVSGSLVERTTAIPLKVTSALSPGRVTGYGVRSLTSMHDPNAMLQGQVRNAWDMSDGETTSNKVIQNLKSKTESGNLGLMDTPDRKASGSTSKGEIPETSAKDNKLVNAGLKSKPNEFSNKLDRYHMKSTEFNNILTGACKLLSSDFATKDDDELDRAIKYNTALSKLKKQALKMGYADIDPKTFKPISYEDLIESKINSIPDGKNTEFEKERIRSEWMARKAASSANSIREIMNSRYTTNQGKNQDKGNKKEKKDYSKYVVPAAIALAPSILSSILPPPPPQSLNPSLEYQNKIRNLELENENLRLKNQLGYRRGDYSEGDFAKTLKSIPVNPDGTDIDDPKFKNSNTKPSGKKKPEVVKTIRKPEVSKDPKKKEEEIEEQEAVESNLPAKIEPIPVNGKKKEETIESNIPAAIEPAKATKPQEIIKSPNGTSGLEQEPEQVAHEEEIHLNPDNGKGKGTSDNGNSDEPDWDSLKDAEAQLKREEKARKNGLKWNKETKKWERIEETPEPEPEYINSSKEGLKNAVGEDNWNALSHKDRRQLRSEAREHNKDVARSKLGIGSNKESDDPLIGLAKQYMKSQEKAGRARVFGNIVKGAGKLLGGAKDTLLALAAPQQTYRPPMNGFGYGYMSESNKSDNEGSKWE